METIWAAIKDGPNTSTCDATAAVFCQTELVERIRCGFSILLSAKDAVEIFHQRLCIFRLASVLHKNRKNRIIYDSTAPPPGGDSLLHPSIRNPPPLYPISEQVHGCHGVTPSMQFGPCLPRFLQAIWEADPGDCPVFLSKWNISDAFHRCILRPFDIGKFTYVVPPSAYRRDNLPVCRSRCTYGVS